MTPVSRRCPDRGSGCGRGPEQVGGGLGQPYRGAVRDCAITVRSRRTPAGGRPTSALRSHDYAKPNSGPRGMRAASPRSSMGQVSASSSIVVNAEPATVLAAIADYQGVRRRSSPLITAKVPRSAGRSGAGTVAEWRLQATKSRSRQGHATIDVAGHTVIEKDANSSLVTNWTVAPAGRARPSPSRPPGTAPAG